MKTKTKNKNGYIASMKCLLKSVREYKKPSILAPIFIALEVIVECTIPYVMTLIPEDRWKNDKGTNYQSAQRLLLCTDG